jgi:hypothetical protein
MGERCCCCLCRCLPRPERAAAKGCVIYCARLTSRLPNTPPAGVFVQSAATAQRHVPWGDAPRARLSICCLRVHRRRLCWGARLARTPGARPNKCSTRPRTGPPGRTPWLASTERVPSKGPCLLEEPGASPPATQEGGPRHWAHHQYACGHGELRESNPRPLAPKARIMPLDQTPSFVATKPDTRLLCSLPSPLSWQAGPPAHCTQCKQQYVGPTGPILLGPHLSVEL